MTLKQLTGVAIILIPLLVLLGYYTIEFFL